MRRRPRWFSSVFPRTQDAHPRQTIRVFAGLAIKLLAFEPALPLDQKRNLVLENRTSNLGWTRVLRWRCVGLEGFVTLKDSWKRMRFPEPGNPTVSSPRAVYSWEPRLIDAIPVGLRRESSSPTPRVQWPRRQFHYVLAK